MPRIREYKPTEEQIFYKNKWDAIDKLALKAGFSDDAMAYTEFSLLPLFELIVEECAKIAEQQARVYSSGAAGKGCHDSANAIRTFAKMIGNYKENNNG